MSESPSVLLGGMSATFSKFGLELAMTLRPVAKLCMLLPLAAFLSAPAHAQSATGPYFGAALSWSTLPTDVSETTIVAPPPPPPEEEGGTTNPDGLGGTLLVGYRFGLAQNIVVGAEFDSTWMNADEKYDNATYGGDWLLTLRGIAGVQVSPNLLLFATAGAAWLDYDVHGGGVHADDTLSGWTVGAGAEWQLTKLRNMAVALRGDYLYANFSSFDYAADTVTPPVTARLFEADTELHQIRIGFVVRPN